MVIQYSSVTVLSMTLQDDATNDTEASQNEGRQLFSSFFIKFHGYTPIDLIYSVYDSIEHIRSMITHTS